MKRILAIGIILLFIGVSISSSTGFNAVEQSNTIVSNGKTLYVGGSGPNNYTKIQDAIDDASDGDTVFVYNGTYVENVVVDKSISLVGEDRNNTIIESMKTQKSIWITISSVDMCNFAIVNNIEESKIGICINQNSGSSMNDSQIKHINISNCIVMNNSIGIEMENVTFVNVTNCDINNNKVGIDIWDNSSNIDIHHNIINNTLFHGIFVGKEIIMETYNISIHNNYISNNGRGTSFDGGIFLQDCKNQVTIKHNIFKSNNKDGIFLLRSKQNLIIENNFIGNVRGAFFRSFCFFNRWNNNYWDDWIGFGPQLIFGLLFFNKIPWIQFDWHPAQEPYNIEV